MTKEFDAIIESRRSIRRFLPAPVERSVVEDILRVASRAPSGSNIQPWQVTVLAGAPLRGLSEAILRAEREAPEAHDWEYDYYPREWTEPYLERRRRTGWGLYGLLGIPKGDKAAMRAQFNRNYVFFDAPVGLIFTIDRILEQGSWLDYGMFLQNVMLAARARGLHTCPQAAFCEYHRVIERYLELPPSQMVVCGMALGHADPGAPENQLVTEREPVAGFSRFLGL
jgi:nitroreductase